MSSVGNNTSKKLEKLRNAFFTQSEKEQFQKIMMNPKEQKIHAKMLKQNAEELYKNAMELITWVELGRFNEKQMEKIEYMISHYLAGIEDLHLELLNEKTMEL